MQGKAKLPMKSTVNKKMAPPAKNATKPKEVGPKIRLLNEKPEDKEKQIVAVIVTFTASSSYDDLFTREQQKSLEGTKVEVYACDALYLPHLAEALDGKPKDDVAIRLMDSIKLVEPDCVVFNWECSSGYTHQTFPEGQSILFPFLKKIVDRGHMGMFSDFSLKALVHEWKEKYELGPNPFVKTGEFSNVFEIRFNSSQLKECPSAQLQIIGDMAEGGKCNIHAAGGTIVYCVDNNKIKHDVYKTEILTIVPTLKPPAENLISQIGEHRGCAGHVLLRYPSGGMILTSMGHWVELMKIDTSDKKLFEVAEKEFGVEEASKMKAEYLSMDVVQQKNWVASKASQFVKNQAPCSNMNKKKRM